MNDEQQYSPLSQVETGPGDHKISPLPQAGEGPGVRAVGVGRRQPSPLRPYIQVALTYLRHMQSLAFTGCLIVAGITLLFGLVVAAMMFYSHGSISILLVFETLIFIIISVHVKEQFTAPRSQLTPNFRNVHAAVAGLFVFFFAVLLPAVMTLTTGSLSIGLVALMVCLFSVTFWCILVNAIFLVFILGVFWPLMASRWVTTTTGPLLSGQYETEAYLALLAGVAAIVAGGMRLMRMNEEMRGYRKSFFSENNEHYTNGSSTDKQTGGPGSFQCLNDLQTVVLTRHARRAAASRWSAVRRWQVGTSAGWVGVARIIGAIIFASVIMWLLSISRNTPSSGDYFTIPVVLFAFMLPWFNLTHLTEQRKEAMCYELLLPEVRTTYFKQLGAAAAMCQLQMWAMTIVLLIVANCILLGEPLPTPGIVSIVIISGLFQIFIFGANSLLALQEGSIFALVLAIVAAVPLLLAWAVSRPLAEWQYASIGVMAFFAAFGLLLARAGYRRWLVVDVE